MITIDCFARAGYLGLPTCTLEREREGGDTHKTEREETDTEGEETHRETDRQRGSRLPKRERENERKSPLSKHSHRGEDPGGFKTKYAQIDFLCRHNRPGSIDQIPDLLCPSRGDGWAVSDTAFPPFPSAEARRGEANCLAAARLFALGWVPRCVKGCEGISDSLWCWDFVIMYLCS